jgi:hypothetical protein
MCGHVSQYEYNRSVWLIRSSPRATQLLINNEKEISTSVKYVVEVEKIKTEGPEPSPRALQSAVYYDKYIAIFGGRSNQESCNCLNDLILFDLSAYRWQALIVYGFIPSKRWGHVMGAEENAILVLGGVGETTLASSSVYKLIMNKKVIKENLIECKKIKTILEVEAKKTQLY